MNTIKNISENKLETTDAVSPKKEITIEISVFEQAIHKQEHQFQIGIESLRKEIENIFQLKSKHTIVVGNRSSRFLNYKNRFQ